MTAKSSIVAVHEAQWTIVRKLLIIKFNLTICILPLNSLCGFISSVTTAHCYKLMQEIQTFHYIYVCPILNTCNHNSKSETKN